MPLTLNDDVEMVDTLAVDVSDSLDPCLRSPFSLPKPDSNCSTKVQSLSIDPDQFHTVC